MTKTLAKMRHLLTVREKRRLLLSGFVMVAALSPTLRTQNLLSSRCVCLPNQSQWNHFYKNADDADFISVMGLPRSTFEEVAAQFGRFYTVRSGLGKSGRPARLQDVRAVLAMLLQFYNGTMQQKRLCLLFGVPTSTQSRILRKAEDALLKCLPHMHDARIAWPDIGQQREWATLISAKEPLVQNKFGFVDGKNLRVQEPTQAERQNAYYNGWLHCVFVTGVLCFGADGTIIWARHNCPGSWNDGDTSGPLQERLLNLQYCPDQRMGIISDSAFPVSGPMLGRIVTPLKEGDLSRLHPSVWATATALSNAVTSVRQAAEWGMGAMEKPFARLTMPLPYNPQLRTIRLSNIFRLFNLRVRRTGISQILNVFYVNQRTH
jgi:hypothetical protein